MNTTFLLIEFMLVLHPVVPADVLLDNQCIVDNALYRTSYHSFCGGEAVYGESYNLQAADGFVLDVEHWITAVSMDFLGSDGIEPDHVCVRFYEHLGRNCELSDLDFAGAELEAGEFAWIEFEDRVFGRAGRRLQTSLANPIRLPADYWYLSVQPSTPLDAYKVPAALYNPDACYGIGLVAYRDGRDFNPCCEAVGEGGWPFWACDGSFDPDTLSMRVEGIPAGACAGGERVKATCRPGDGEELGRIVVKVRRGQAGESVTALLNPPDPRNIRILLDDRGRGKGKFMDVPLGEHRVFVCDAVLDASCGR